MFASATAHRFMLFYALRLVLNQTKTRLIGVYRLKIKLCQKSEISLENRSVQSRITIWGSGHPPSHQVRTKPWLEDTGRAFSIRPARFATVSDSRRSRGEGRGAESSPNLSNLFLKYTVFALQPLC